MSQSDEIKRVQTTLDRVETKLDDGLINHEGRIAKVEGTLASSRWAVGTILTLMGLAIAGFAIIG